MENIDLDTYSRDDLELIMKYTGVFNRQLVKDTDVNSLPLRIWLGIVHRDPSVFPYINNPTDEITKYAIHRDGYLLDDLEESKQTLELIKICLKGRSGGYHYSSSGIKNPLLREYSIELNKLYMEIERCKDQMHIELNNLRTEIRRMKEAQRRWS